MPLSPLVRALTRVRLMLVARAALGAAAMLTGVASCGGSSDGAPSGPAPVTPVLTTVTVAAPGASLLGKQTTQLTAVTLDQTGKAMTATVSWSSSSATIASVSATGLVTAGAAGTATVTASAVAGGVTRTATAAITVVEGVTSVVVTPATLALVVGGTGTLAAAVVADPRAATTVTWTTSSAAAATVSALGVVTAVGAGTSQVCAVSTFDAAKQGCAAVTVSVSVAAVASVTVTPATAALTLGQTQLFVATMRDAGGNTLTGRAIAWTTSSAAVATVSAAGLVSTTGAGTATITATSEGRTGTGTVTVTSPSVTSVVVTPASPSVTAGQTVQLSAAVNGTGGPPTGVSWLSADVSKVTVSASGLATGVAATAGTQVCATSTFDTSKSGCASVAVTAPVFPANATMSAPGFVFSPSQVDISVGGSVSFVFTNVTHNVVFNATAGAPANVPNTQNATVTRQFGTVGTFNLQCTLHSGMTGVVVVH